MSLEITTTLEPRGPAGAIVLDAVEIGDEVHVVIERDDAPREIAIPDELQRALDADPVAKAAFERLAPSHRKEHARAVADAKRPETRAKRVAATLAALRG